MMEGVSVTHIARVLEGRPWEDSAVDVRGEVVPLQPLVSSYQSQLGDGRYWEGRWYLVL